jgi:hypothetical protein
VSLSKEITMTRSIVFAAVLLLAIPAAAQLHVQYLAKSLVVTGASARGDVAVFSVSHTNFHDVERLYKQESIERADANGAFTLIAVRPSFRSVWLLVDLRSGDFVISTPPGYDIHRTAVPADAIDRSGVSLLLSKSTVDVFIARKGQGAWHARAGEIGSDSPGSGRVSARIDHLKPIGSTSPAPPVLTPGDIVMVFDAPYMQFWATKLTAADLQGAK